MRELLWSASSFVIHPGAGGGHVSMYLFCLFGDVFMYSQILSHLFCFFLFILPVRIFSFSVFVNPKIKKTIKEKKRKKHVTICGQSVRNITNLVGFSFTSSLWVPVDCIPYEVVKYLLVPSYPAIYPSHHHHHLFIYKERVRRVQHLHTNNEYRVSVFIRCSISMYV